MTIRTCVLVCVVLAVCVAACTGVGWLASEGKDFIILILSIILK